MTSRKTLLTRLVGLTLAMVAASAAQAQAQSREGGGPWYLRAAQTFTHDSNLFRVPDDDDDHESDTISTTELTAGLDQPYGRQRYLGELSLFLNRFQDNDQLNNTGHEALLGMDWSAAQRLSGDVRLRSRERLASFSDFGTLGNDEVKESVNSVDFRAQYGAASTWMLESGAGYRDVKFSVDGDNEDAFEAREFDQARFFVGAGYRPSDLIRFGVRLRHAQGTYGSGADEDDYDRNDLELNTLWRASGLSTIDARLAFTREDHDPDFETRDFSGVTGSVGWTYVPTGKLQFDTRFIRDTSNRGGTFDVAPDAGFLTDSRVRNRLSLAARWLATAKITVDGRVEYARDKYDAEFVDRDDVNNEHGSTRSAQLRASYAINRAWLVSCSIGRQSRSTPFDDDQTGLPRDYDANFGGCTAQFEIRP